ncbi:hypothetical protein P3H15_47640 [Rhodococcus sp. T2V]|uniref:hypothetical protein n=1 Tax=Rhodococcus sp. T2V TaxID=3034164 RepID=UPI0023E29C2C|nr:hypothetical protein [Rhodococcus sp. T2V]MDF3312621.1 hypothetical protein [Rhodococcus sp. T2V]
MELRPDQDVVDGRIEQQVRDADQRLERGSLGGENRSAGDLESGTARVEDRTGEVFLEGGSTTRPWLTWARVVIVFSRAWA